LKYLDRFSFRVLTLLLIYAAYLTIFIRFFPNKFGGVGHDYAYWFPRMIAGAYWYMQNGLFSVPWFTPALNGGNLLYADPESVYFSFPQFVAFFVDPLTSITITFATFSLVGLLGFYLLSRKIFGCSFLPSLLGAALFLFNGLFTYRMIVGHLPYHGFMLLPWILLCILWKNDRFTIYHETIWAAVAAILLSYCFYSGGIHFLIPLTLSIIVVGLIYSYTFVNRLNMYIWVRFSILSIITGMLCASKLIAAFNVIRNLPREAYLLPGIPNLVDLFIVPIRSLFFASIARLEANGIFDNLQWALDRHEFEYGITFLPLVFLIAEICRRLTRFQKRKNFALWAPKKRLLLLAIFLILLLPIFVNYYTPQWNSFLKTVPVIKSSSTLVRWYAMYIPIGILFSVLAFEKLRLNSIIKSLLTGIFILVIVTINLMHDKTFCYVNSYNYRPILQGFLAAKSQDRIPNIEHIGLSATIDTPSQKMTYTNDNLINVGVSYLLSRCSLFGYKLEFFPQIDKLKIGRVDLNSEGDFNMKNPSCYLYPDENGCDPGDHFRSDQVEQLNNFISYRPFGFKINAAQRVANWVSLITFLTCLLLLIMHLTYRYALHRSPKIGSKHTGRNFSNREKITNA